MDEVLQFLIKHGYVVLFFLVFFEQLGLPLPAAPVLLAVGALAGTGQMSFSLAIAISIIACLLSDVVWYEIGRRKGAKVLKFLCRISLEPDTCVRRTQDLFTMHGARSLMFAKFIPGYNTVAPPLAGIVGMKLSSFVLFDAAGAFLWAGAFQGIGYLFSNQLEQAANYVAQFGASLLTIAIVGFAGYILWKYIKLRLFIRDLRVARISPEQLKKLIEKGEEVVIVDLRHSVELEADPFKVPGALQMGAEELEARGLEIPRNRDVILYCS